MNKLLIALLATTLLAGCAAKPRTGSPAPIDSSRTQSAPPLWAPAEPEATVKVYAYRPPVGAPDAPPAAMPPETQPQQPGGSAGTMTALLSEQATPTRVQRGTAMTSAPAQTQSQTTTPPLAPPSATGPAPRQTQPPRSPDTAGSQMAALTPPVVAPKPAPPPPPPQPVTYRAPPPAMPELPPAAASLAAQAEQQRERGDYVTAAATLERALRIQPQEPYLWNRLARVRLDQQNYAQAGSLAQKSNALSKDQGQIKQDNWGMIAATRRAAGDLSGAEEAEAKAGGD